MFSSKNIMEKSNGFPGILNHSSHPCVVVIMVLSTSVALSGPLDSCLSSI